MLSTNKLYTKRHAALITHIRNRSPILTLHFSSFHSLDEIVLVLKNNPTASLGSNDPVDHRNKNRNRDKKRGGVVDLLLPFTANDAELQSPTTARSGRKRHGPKHQPKLVPGQPFVGPSFVPGNNERNR